MLFHLPWLSREDEGGYVSLTEAAATVAVGLTLAAALNPVIIAINDEAKITRARQDVAAIVNAIDKFVKDVAEFPIRSTPGIAVPFPRTAAEASLPFLDPNAVPCERSGTTPLQDPNLALSLVTAACGPAFLTTPPPSPGFFLNNHLVFDAMTLTAGLATPGFGTPVSLQYRLGGTGQANTPRNWNGPYIKQVLMDPWGHNYLLYTHAMNRSHLGPNGLQLYSWVLSAGPNGLIETLPTSPVVQGDDIGMLAAVLNVPEENFRLPQRS